MSQKDREITLGSSNLLFHDDEVAVQRTKAAILLPYLPLFGKSCSGPGLILHTKQTEGRMTQDPVRCERCPTRDQQGGWRHSARGEIRAGNETRSRPRVARRGAAVWPPRLPGPRAPGRPCGLCRERNRPPDRSPLRGGQGGRGSVPPRSLLIPSPPPSRARLLTHGSRPLSRPRLSGSLNRQNPLNPLRKAAPSR